MSLRAVTSIELNVANIGNAQSLVEAYSSRRARRRSCRGAGWQIVLVPARCRALGQKQDQGGNRCGENQGRKWPAEIKAALG